ncbi:MAG: hypothetical protein IPK72_07395 [Candidatus Eisenbacteria bacterium]|nr:hypothetical protein [Candidatus Eisenbacteria bacterium]
MILLLYRLLTGLLAVIGAPLLIWRGWKHPAEMAERFGRIAPPPAGGVWFHAASLGEVEALRSLLAAAGAARPTPVLVTVTSTSARRRAAERLGPAIEVRFAPLDLDLCVRTFLRRAQPRALVILETELWPVTLDLCRRAGLPRTLVSGRLSDRNWRRLGLWRSALRACLDPALPVSAQSPRDAARFRALGFHTVVMDGNVKYRLDPETSSELRGARGGRPLIVVGSLRRGEEAVLSALAGIAGRPPFPRVVLAPRHLHEGDLWVARATAAGFRPERRSDAAAYAGWETRSEFEPESQVSAPDLLVLDLHGELRAWYSRADIAIVGGTFVPIGGHSLFEPAALGVPVLFGPYEGNVRDVADCLLARGGGVRLASAEAIPEAITPWLSDPLARETAGAAARAAADDLGGAAERAWRRLAESGWALGPKGRAE